MYRHAGTPFGGASINMQSVSIRDGRVKIRPNAVVWAISGLLVICAGVFAVLWLWDRLEGRTEHIPEPSVVCVFLGLVTLGLLLLWYIRGRSVTIDSDGVEWRLLFRKRRLSWYEIFDYGLSYAYWGQVRLYFSAERLETNGKGKKRMRGRPAVILIHIQNRGQTGHILNVCRAYTRVRPFLCSKEGRLVGILRDR